MNFLEYLRWAPSLRRTVYAAIALWALITVGLATHAFGQAAMIYGTDAVSSPDAVSLPQSTELWFTQGNGTSTNGTQVSSYWVNKVAGEESSAIQGACALTLNMSAYNQLNLCILSIQAQIAALGGRVTHGVLLATTVFTSSGTFTPNPAAVTFDIEMAGGGGGGGGAAATDSGHISVGSGGAAGSYIRFITTANLSGAAIAVGGGGAGGAAGSLGGAGGVTIIGGIGYCPATGQAGTASGPTGSISQVGQGGQGGLCSATGQVIVSSAGQSGLNSLLLGNGVMSGQGAPSVFGGGSGNTNNGPGGTSYSPASGGAGAACPPSCTGNPGGNGAPGIVIIRQYS